MAYPLPANAGTYASVTHQPDVQAPGQALRGPAIVESANTTVLPLPGDTARMDARGWLEITLKERSCRNLNTSICTT